MCVLHQWLKLDAVSLRERSVFSLIVLVDAFLMEDVGNALSPTPTSDGFCSWNVEFVRVVHGKNLSSCIKEQCC